MIVVDASVVIGYLARSEAATRALTDIDGDGALCAPEMLRLEVLQWLRRRVRTGSIPEARAGEALDDLQLLRIEDHPHAPLVPLVWELRDNLTSYDACYLALAQALEARLITADRGQAAVARRILGEDRVLLLD